MRAQLAGDLKSGAAGGRKAGLFDHQARRLV
jgi:hypothetical protein